MVLPLSLLLLAHLFDDLTALFGVPGTGVGEGASTRAVALPAERLGEVFGGDLLEEFVLVLVTEDLDFFDGDGVEPALDDGPYGGEDVRSVDDVELAHGLWVVVLADVGGLLYVGGYLPEGGDADVLEVHDGARGFDELAAVGGADGETLALELFVLDDEFLDLAFWGGDLVERPEVEFAELLDVDGATVVVGLVVVLRVVLVYLRLFGILKVVVELLHVEFGSPLFGLGEHGLGGGLVPLACAEESAEAGIVVTLRVEEALVLDGCAEGVERLLLGSVKVAGAS